MVLTSRARSMVFALLTPLLLCSGVAALAACNGGPPHRSSPLLVKTATIGADAMGWDLLAPSGLWRSMSPSGQDQFEGPSGIVAPPITGHEAEPVRHFRGLAGGDLWACVDTGVAQFTAAAWRFTPWAKIATLGPSAYCEGLAARSSSDVWLVTADAACHFDGATWACRTDVRSSGSAPSLTLSARYAWLGTDGPADPPSDALLAFDTSSMSSMPITLSIGDMRYVGQLLPVPGSDQVWAFHQAAADGNTAPHLFAPTGLVRTSPGSFIVPLAEGDEYVLDVSSSDQTTCSGGFGGSCGSTTKWSQLVVSRQKSGASTELAHLDDPSGGNVPGWALMLGGSLVFPGPTTYRLP